MIPAMTERGLPIVDGAPACPFVAFEDDRDGRATAPDHRHRCFAEPRPAPRALAHQEAYCLSSAFPVCPTFQDWARREAAAARAAAPDRRAPRDEPPVSTPLPPRDREQRHAWATETPAPVPPRRNPRRDWAAPPPWLGDAASDGEDGETEPPSFLAGRDAGRESLARDAGGRERDAGRDEEAWARASRGLAGSQADRLAGGDLDEPAPARPVLDPSDADDRARRPAAAGADARWHADDEDEPDEPAVPLPPRRPRGRGAERRADRGLPPPEARQAPGRRRDRDEEAAELFGPAWERPRRFEAYPTLRTRVGIPAIPRIVVAALALALAALALFFLGPMLLGLGGDGLDIGGGGGRATPTATVAPSASVEPTATPAPTPKTYTVSSGDTMSKIAKRFGITLEALLGANPQIKNPDKIKIGDQLVIPPPTPGGEE